MSEVHRISTLQQLEAIYGAPRPQSLLKEVTALTPEYATWIKASPLAVLASVGADGLDCTPRGDPAGFVDVVDDKTLVLPDRAGNNRIDTLRNLIADPRIALLFLVPGRDETIRVAGRAVISTDPELLQRYVVAGKVPQTAMIITVERVYFQCARALKRARLWCADSDEGQALPSIGDILKSISNGQFDGAAYDAELRDRMNKTLY